MSDFLREPVTIVEIDVEYCGLEYGVGACPAVLGADSDDECYNFYKGCPVKVAFSRTTKTLRYSNRPIPNPPAGEIVYPFLRSVSTNPTEIALGATDDRLGTFGKRSRWTIKLDDHPDSDISLDKYVSGRSYDPLERGTHFGKLFARWPYYYGRAVRIKTGNVGDDIATMNTRSAILTARSGPSSARSVTFTAQDPLKLADDELSQCPALSVGKLGEDIGTGMTSFDLTPSGVGDDYDADGWAQIGDELVTFARSGDTITLTGRGMGGTEAENHDAEDLFQQAFAVDNERPEDVLRVLLRDYAGIDESWLDYANWQSELTRWMATFRLTRVIGSPTAVRDLCAEIADMGIIIWWDEVASLVRVRATRPLDIGETAKNLTDAANWLEGTASPADAADLRVSQVWAIHKMKSYTEDADDTDNYDRVDDTADLLAEGDLEYAQSAIKKIYLPWLGQVGDAVIAKAVAYRLLKRNRDIPKTLTGAVDYSDAAELQIGSFAIASTATMQDESGAPAPVEMIVTSVEETSPNHRVEVVLQSSEFIGRHAFFTEPTRSDYDGSTDDERRWGGYLVGPSGEFSDGSEPYILF